MRTIRHLIDLLGSATFHINWYFLCALIVVCAFAVGLATRRR